MAALAMQRALELDSEEPQWRAERDRLLLCIPEHTSALLQVCKCYTCPQDVLQRWQPYCADCFNEGASPHSALPSWPYHAVHTHCDVQEVLLDPSRC